MKRLARVAAFVLLASLAAPAAADVVWRPFSPDVFRRAKAEKKLVLLDLVAVWCHWCHVMDEKTYGDPEVARLLAERFVTVRVDQDAQPDVSARYEDWGWPATIVFGADGKELVKRSGYIPKDAMLAMLRAVAADPTPGPSVRPEAKLAAPSAGALSPALRRELEGTYLETYDQENGSWGFRQKFLEPGSVELALRTAGAGDARAEEMARKTLAAQVALLDPVWGGVYQYSTGGVWTEPHFEKLLAFQASNLRVYAGAYALWKDPEHLRVARAIRGYVDSFLKSPEGAFYPSQDADLVPGEHSAEYFALDDAGRRARGVPRVDTHLYARENGWMIDALCTLHAATKDQTALDEALAAARWVVANRALPGGGLRHGDADEGGPFLSDTASMGRAFTSLWEATGDREWLDKANSAAALLVRFARADGVGYASSVRVPGRPEPKPNRDENVLVARFASALAKATGDPAHRAIAATAMRYLAAPSVARVRPVGPVLLADAETRDVSRTGR